MHEQDVNMSNDSDSLAMMRSILSTYEDDEDEDYAPSARPVPATTGALPKLEEVDPSTEEADFDEDDELASIYSSQQEASDEPEAEDDADEVFATVASNVSSRYEDEEDDEEDGYEEESAGHTETLAELMRREALEARKKPVHDLSSPLYNPEGEDEEEDEEYDQEDANAHALNLLANPDLDEDDGEANFRMTSEDYEILQGFDIDEILSRGVELGASDVFIRPGENVLYSVNGDMQRDDSWGIVPADVSVRIQQNIVSNELGSEFNRERELNAGYAIKTGPHKGRRMRVNAGLAQSEVFITFRILSDEVPDLDALGVEEEIREWMKFPRGLVMMNGQTGTGKSTTLAGLIGYAIETRPINVIAIEKPTEFVFPKNTGMGSIIQREVGPDTRTFSKGLDSSMRSLPNILFIGEVRNQEEIYELLRAAETGHLAVSTMHTNSAPETIQRIKNIFQGPEQLSVLTTLAFVARGFANQVLLKTPDGKGRFAVREVLTVTEEVSNLILEGDVRGLRDYQIRKGITLEHNLVKVVKEGRATLETARSAAGSQALFDRLMEEHD